MTPLFRKPDYTEENCHCWRFAGGDHKLWWDRARGWSLISDVFSNSGAGIRVEVALGPVAPGLLFCALSYVG